MQVDYFKSVNKHKKYDIIVAGGGPSGIAAAIASSRQGMKTLLLEGTGCLGGTSVSGALPFWLGAMTGSIPFKKMLGNNLQYKDLPRKQYAVKGIFLEAVERIKSEGGGVGPAVLAQSDRYPGLDRLGCHDEFTFDLEIGKRVLEEMVMESGADLLFFTTVLDVKRTGKRIDGLYIVNKDGLTYLEGAAFVDCTGDADVVSRAGFETYKGDRKTGLMSSVSLITHLEGVCSRKVADYLDNGGDPLFRKQCLAAIKENPGADLNPQIIMFPMVEEGVFMVNDGTTFEFLDGTSAKDITKLMLAGRQRAKNILEKIFKPYIPGFENARIRLTASYPGIRETRRIMAEYILTEEDVLGGKEFEDTIALGGRHFDLGRPVKNNQGHIESIQPMKDAGIYGGVTHIPYRALIPKNTDNIIAAGRCIAADGQAMGPARIMSTCFATGQAAGIAAAMCIHESKRFIQLDTQVLRNTLVQNGAVLNGKDVRSFV